MNRGKADFFGVLAGEGQAGFILVDKNTRPGAPRHGFDPQRPGAAKRVQHDRPVQIEISFGQPAPGHQHVKNRLAHPVAGRADRVAFRRQKVATPEFAAGDPHFFPAK